MWNTYSEIKISKKKIEKLLRFSSIFFYVLNNNQESCNILQILALVISKLYIILISKW